MVVGTKKGFEILIVFVFDTGGDWDIADDAYGSF